MTVPRSVDILSSKQPCAINRAGAILYGGRTALASPCILQPRVKVRVGKAQDIRAFFEPPKRVARAAFDSRTHSCMMEVIVTHERVRNNKPPERRIAVHTPPARGKASFKVLPDEKGEVLLERSRNMACSTLNILYFLRFSSHGNNKSLSKYCTLFIFEMLHALITNCYFAHFIISNMRYKYLR